MTQVQTTIPIHVYVQMYLPIHLLLMHFQNVVIMMKQ